MARTLPPMMQVMKDIGGVEIPETLANMASAAQSTGPARDRDGSKPADATPAKP